MVASWAVNVCRLCLSDAAVHDFWPEHAEYLAFYSSIHIEKNSALPDKLCDKCVDSLNGFHIFFKRAVHAQLALNEIEKKNQNSSDDDSVRKYLLEVFENLSGQNSVKKSLISKILESYKTISPEKDKQIVKIDNFSTENISNKTKLNLIEDQKKVDTKKKHVVKINNPSNNSGVLSKNMQLLSSKKFVIDKNKYASPVCAPIRTKNSHVEFFLSNSCSICNIKFSTYGDLVLHNLNVHFSSTNRLNTVTCDLCKKEYKNKYMLSRHKKKSHSAASEVMCDKCSHICVSSLELKKHKKSCGSALVAVSQTSVNCRICNKVFENKEGLNIHMESHVTNVCEYCNCGYASAIFLLNHVSEKHSTKKNPYNCYHCSETFTSKDMILKHGQVKHDSFHEVFFCGHCNVNQLIFNNVFDLWSHIESVHNTILDLTETPVQSGLKFCKIAPNLDSFVIEQPYKACENINLLNNSIKISEIINLPIVQYSEVTSNKNISLSTDAAVSLFEHTNNDAVKALSMCHSPNYKENEIIDETQDITSKPNNSEDDIENTDSKLKKKMKNFQCNVCCKKFLRLSNLQKHITIHKSQEPICLACNFQALTQADLNKHIKECKTFWKMNDLPCPICKKTVSTSAGLRYHLKIHSSDLKHKCTKCPKRFITVGKLNLHTRAMHSEIKPFMCNSCPRSYAVSDHLKKHVLFAHVNQRNHICSVCNKSFLQKSHLNHHMWIHTGVKPHKCPYCPNKYSARCSLTKHLRRNHWEQQCEKKNGDDLIEKLREDLITTDEAMEADVIDGISLVIVGD